MSDSNPATISVLDFRRRRMAVQWNLDSGAWVSHEEAPPLVHGIALIRPGGDNVCLYGHAGSLLLQIGTVHHALTPAGIAISCERVALSLGFRRHVKVESARGEVLFTYQYWIGSRPDFFKLLADKAASQAWRDASAQAWSEGISSAQLRESWAR